MAAVLPRLKPAFKVAASGPARIRGSRRIDAEPYKNPWQKYQLKLIPKRINGKWYRPGEWVYRRWAISPGGGFWVYGDDFDYLRGH